MSDARALKADVPGIAAPINDTAQTGALHTDRRENFLRFMHHESHDHIPTLMDVCMRGADSETFENSPLTGGLGGFGCGWVKTASAMGAGTPASGDPVVPDVTEWRDYVRFPNIAEFDWEGLAKQQLAEFNPESQVINYSC